MASIEFLVRNTSLGGNVSLSITDSGVNGFTLKAGEHGLTLTDTDWAKVIVALDTFRRIN